MNKYKISEGKKTHIKLTKIELNDDETSSMLARYNFDPSYADMKLAEIQRDMDELQIQIEQKNYEEMNYTAICKRLYNYSTFELLQQLVENIIAMVKHT